MSIVLYSTGCPKCNVLETKMKEKNIQYDLITDENIMVEKGFMESPIVEVDREYFNFGRMIKLINNFESSNFEEFIKSELEK